MATLIKPTGGWPSKCQRQKSKTGPEAVKQNTGQNCERLNDLFCGTVSGVCVFVRVFTVCNQFTSKLMDLKKKIQAESEAQEWVHQSHHAQVSAVWYFLKEGKKNWEPNRHHEVFLVAGCRDWWQWLGLR